MRYILVIALIGSCSLPAAAEVGQSTAVFFARLEALLEMPVGSFRDEEPDILSVDDGSLAWYLAAHRRRFEIDHSWTTRGLFRLGGMQKGSHHPLHALAYAACLNVGGAYATALAVAKHSHDRIGEMDRFERVVSELEAQEAYALISMLSNYLLQVKSNREEVYEFTRDRYLFDVTSVRPELGDLNAWAGRIVDLQDSLNRYVPAGRLERHLLGAKEVGVNIVPMRAGEAGQRIAEHAEVYQSRLFTKKPQVTVPKDFLHEAPGSTENDLKKGPAAAAAADGRQGSILLHPQWSVVANAVREPKSWGTQLKAIEALHSSDAVETPSLYPPIAVIDKADPDNAVIVASGAAYLLAYARAQVQPGDELADRALDLLDGLDASGRRVLRAANAGLEDALRSVAAYQKGDEDAAMKYKEKSLRRDPNLSTYIDKYSARWDLLQKEGGVESQN